VTVKLFITEFVLLFGGGTGVKMGEIIGYIIGIIILVVIAGSILLNKFGVFFLRTHEKEGQTKPRSHEELFGRKDTSK
jgi:hypothetical protein